MSDLIELKTVQLIHKGARDELPCHLQALFMPENVHTYSTRQRKFEIQRTYTILRDQSPIVCGKRLYNKLKPEFTTIRPINHSQDIIKTICFLHITINNHNGVSIFICIRTYAFVLVTFCLIKMVCHVYICKFERIHYESHSY